MPDLPATVLPHEVWLKILHRLPGHVLALTRLVARSWRIRADDPILWRALCWNAGIDTSRYVVKRCGGDDDDGGPSLIIDWPATFAAHIMRERNRAKRFWASHHDCIVSPTSTALTVDPALRRIMVLVPPAPCQQCIVERAVWTDLGWGVDEVDIPVPWLLASSPPDPPAASSSIHSVPPRPLLSRASALMHTLTSGCDLAAGLKDFVPRFQVMNKHEWMSDYGFGGTLGNLGSALSVSPPVLGFSDLGRAFSQIRVGSGDQIVPFEGV